MKALNKFHSEQIIENDKYYHNTLLLIEQTLNEQKNESKKNIILRSKGNATRLQTYIQDIQSLDRKKLSSSQKLQVTLTDKIIRAELRLLNQMIALKDWDFLSVFSPYRVLI